jgi:hypothetical protein
MTGCGFESLMQDGVKNEAFYRDQADLRWQMQMQMSSKPPQAMMERHHSFVICTGISDPMQTMTTTPMLQSLKRLYS